MNLELKRYEIMSSRLLFTHGYLPNRQGDWIKRDDRLLAIARIELHVLCLELSTVINGRTMSSIRKHYVNLTQCDEVRLQRALEGFEVE